MSKFNKEQEAAIRSRGNVIVSAGAGSGKTTVLTERVKQNILGIDCERVNLDELLILTFTNDAADSMKTKIKNALIEVGQLDHLVPLVDSAHIETIDAYQKFIVSKYGQQFGYPKKINILPEDVLLVKIIEILEGIFDELYKSNNPIFKELIYNYCIKDDKKLFEFIVNIYIKFLLKTPQKLDILEKYKQNYLNKNYFSSLILLINQNILKDINEYENLINQLYTTEIQTIFEEKLALLRGINDLEDLLNASSTLTEIKTKTLNDKLDDIHEDFIREIESETCTKLTRIYNQLCSLSTFDLNAFNKVDINNQIKYLSFVIDEILVKLVKVSEKFKLETGYFTFADISHIASKILEKNEGIRNELKNQYKLIMIDEYQDNSSEQNDFISLISNDNVFCVGDVKQSIYKFRGAAPHIFQEKYDSYKVGNGGVAIDMNTNYRSRKEIIESVNETFSKLMTSNFGGAEYKKDHIIIAGNKLYDKFQQSCYAHGISIIENAKNYNEDEKRRKNSKKLSINGEARAIALDIKSRILGGYEVLGLDKMGQLVSRKASFKDFAILTFKTKNFDTYESVFKELHIPVKVEYNENITKDMTIVVISNIFKLLYLLQIENPSKVEEGQIKHCLISILRSYVSKVDDEQIYNLFKDQSDNYKNSIIYKKYADFARLYKHSPLAEIYLDILKKENFIENVSELRDAINVIEKNNIFYDKIKIMDELGYSLKDLSEYFARVNLNRVEIDQTINSAAEDAVTLTTIHKSKGLEYPCVYLPSLFDFEPPMNRKTSDYYVIDDYFFLPFFSDPSKKAGFINYSFKKDADFNRQSDEERLRLFYVAVTRAKEDIVFVFSDEAPKSFDDVYKIIKQKIIDLAQQNGRTLTNDALEKETQERIKYFEEILSGRDFIDFLKKSYSTFPVTPYIDKQFLNFENTLNEYLENNHIELNESEYADVINRFNRLFKENSFDLHNVNIDEFMSTTIVKVQNNKLNKITEDKNLYNGIYYLKDIDKYIEKINLKIDKGNVARKYLEFVFKDNEIHNSVSLDEDIYSKCSSLIAYNKIDELVDYVQIFTQEYEFIDDLPNDGLQVLDLELRNLNIERVVIEKSKKASKDLDDQADYAALHYGTHLHALLEAVDFANPNYSLLKDNATKIKKVIDLINSKCDLNKYEIFKEYQFEDLINGTNGVIDLLLVSEDEVLIFDYKLKNIDDEKYNEQLKVYKDYVEITFKPKNIKTFLLSILGLTIEERKV